MICVVGMLPRAYAKVHEDTASYGNMLSIETVMEFLQKNAQANIVYTRRIPILAAEWLSVDDPNITPRSDLFPP